MREAGKPHFRLCLLWLVEWQVLDQWERHMRHVGCKLCVTQLPETSGFLADPKLVSFCLVGNRICRVRKARLQNTLTSSRIVWGVTSSLHRISAGSSRLVNLRLSTTQLLMFFRRVAKSPNILGTTVPAFSYILRRFFVLWVDLRLIWEALVFILGECRLGKFLRGIWAFISLCGSK